MKKYDWLKTVVIVQAIAMIILAGFVMVKWWPLLGERAEEQPSPTSSREQDDVEEGGSDVVASIGDQTIVREQLTKELYDHYGDIMLRSMMVQRALEFEATEKNIAITEYEIKEELNNWIADYNSEEQFYMMMMEQLGMNKQQVLNEVRHKLLLDKITMSMVTITNSQIDQYIASHPDQFMPEVLLRMRWIVTESKQDANEVLFELEQGADFAQLAREYSVDPFTADEGGDMGQIAANDPFYDKQLLVRASTMQPGQMIGPVEMDKGYAILQLLGKETKEIMSIEKQREEAHKQLAIIEAMPQQQVEEELLKKYNALISK